MSSKKNNGQEFTGRLGNTVTYYLGTTLVKRTVGENNGPRSEKQLAFYKLSKEVSHFLNVVKEFISIGFSLTKKGVNTSPVNRAMAYTFQNAIKGSFPNQEIDFTKVAFSQGRLDNSYDHAVKAIDRGLEFTWDTIEDITNTWADTVMLMAYIPALNDARYLLSGARREAGVEVLQLTGIPDGTLIYTYISFISASHKAISNSQYIGTVVWNEV